MTTAFQALTPPLGSVENAPRPAYPLRYDVPPQQRHNRLSVAFRPLLAIPYLIVVAVFGWLAYLLVIVGWLSIVFAATFDRTLWGWVTGYLRRRAYLTTYLACLRDEYPPFGDGPYPVSFEVAYPARRSRASTFFRALLLLPQLYVVYVLLFVWGAALALAWLAILITGTYPEGLRRLIIGFNRWLLRVEAYALLARDEYPPFSLGLNEVAPENEAAPPAHPEPWPVLMPINTEVPTVVPLAPPASFETVGETVGEAAGEPAEAVHADHEPPHFHAVPWRPGSPSAEPTGASPVHDEPEPHHEPEPGAES